MSRGELRIYVGAAPGVGKTFAMLNEGWRRQHRGTDVVIGYVEDHGRPATAAQIRNLEIIPRATLTYRDQQFEEMDIDAVLARKPRIALVDELAHTNVPGSRNEKRWQDIEELLAAGINVISTVNIQHLESLNDVVEEITGIVQRETVPDAVVRAADQIELVDMTPEALRRRMAHGNVYAAEKVDAALANYFRVGNLSALRELALLWVADRVDEGLEEYRERHGITAPWETRERVVVALTGAPDGDRLVRRGARLAARTKAELVGVHVRSADGLATPNQELLERHRGLLQQLGGRYAEVTGTDVADALVRFARAENSTQIVLGATKRSRWAELTKGSVINRVISQARDVDVHVISADAPEIVQPRRGPLAPRRRLQLRRPSRALAIAWVVALVITPLYALALTPLEDSVDTSGQLLLLLLAPIGAALVGGLYPALVAAAVAFVAADWLYIDPTSSLQIARVGDLVALVVFVAVAAVVSVLVDRLARRTAQVASGQAESEALAGLVHGTAVFDADALARLVTELRRTLDLDAVAVLAPTTDGWRVEAVSGDPVPSAPDDGSYAAELRAGTMLVVAGPPLPAADRRLLTAFVDQLRLAQTTLALQTEATRAAALDEANDLRDALLAAVSHDLRGPLANIKAAATSLVSPEVDWGTDDVKAFAKTIDTEADRLTTLIVNLLDLSRMQAGMLGVHIEPTAVAGAVYAALASLGREAAGVDVDVADSLPLVRADGILLERALANVIQNAANWAPDGTSVRVEAGTVGDRVDIRVIDRGVGIARDKRHAVFEPFQRLGDGGPDAHEGLGLGLAVAKGFVDAMDGSIAIDDTPGGGATVTIGLGVGS
jgi:two-component system, OmpR family, sensor histidine kinase KdpD